jgi:hypothetical protein
MDYSTEDIFNEAISMMEQGIKVLKDPLEQKPKTNKNEVVDVIMEALGIAGYHAPAYYQHIPSKIW